MTMLTTAPIGVDNFVAEHGGEFRFGIEFRQKTAVDCNFAPRQRPCIGSGFIEYGEFEVQLVFSACPFRESLTHLLDIFRQFRIEDELTALGLLHGCVHLCPDLLFPLVTVNLEMPFASYLVYSAS